MADKQEIEKSLCNTCEHTCKQLGVVDKCAAYDKLSSPEKEQAGDNIGRCKACGNVLQKEGCPACHEKEQAGKEKDKGNISDGYHTFNELYDHRCLLWINICLMTPNTSYLVKEHYVGWFLLGNETPYGQVSYHCPNKYLPLVKSIKERKVEYDGHTSPDVIKRLEQLANSMALSHPPSPCGEDLYKKYQYWHKLAVNREVEIKRYREALEKIIQADKDLLTNHDSWGWAMNEMTEEVNDSLDNLFGSIKEAKTALATEKEER